MTVQPQLRLRRITAVATAVWTPSGPSVYTNTFVNTPNGGTNLTLLDLAGAFAAGGNPAAPTLSLDSTYLVSLEWAWASSSDNNNVVWSRGISTDPGGQIMIELNQGAGFKTFAAARDSVPELLVLQPWGSILAYQRRNPRPWYYWAWPLRPWPGQLGVARASLISKFDYRD